MAEVIKVVAQPRTEKGKGAVRRLRNDGKLPGVVYGQGEESQPIELNAHDFEQLLAHHTSEHLMIELQVGKGKVKKVLLKEVQHHPVTGRVQHADFHEISMERKLRVAIPVEFSGEPLGVTQQGGVLEHLLRELEVECLPADIIERIDVDVTDLMIGDRVTVGDITLDPAKYVILNAADVAVAAVAAPRVQEEEEAPAEEEEAAVAEEGAEPEVIGEKEREERKGDEKEAAGE